ncbi:HNH endonuclease [Vibrio phage 11895-B1]|uniref:HNH endonuclease n=1 Tax=Vibrio phage 11895-B1 TaxID=754075 RepID=UPI0002C09F65|nr:HNH endonuclease [Vibrio phage 11895-B1]AGH32089.1 hypothetical protein VPHG_00022 [Vibrio phage 11895-B1]
MCKGSDGKRIKYKEFSYWLDMSTRCNNPNYALKFPTYKDVIMSDTFEDYNIFVEWCRSKPQFFEDNFVLDKDIVLPKNKIYHEDFCNFVPPQVNGFFVMRTNGRNKELPVGVSWCNSEGKFKAYCSQLNGKNKMLGRFKNEVEAGIAYINYKNSLAPKLLKIYYKVLSEGVIEALESYNVLKYIPDGASIHPMYNNLIPENNF